MQQFRRQVPIRRQAIEDERRLAVVRRDLSQKLGNAPRAASVEMFSAALQTEGGDGVHNGSSKEPDGTWTLGRERAKFAVPLQLLSAPPVCAPRTAGVCYVKSLSA